MALMALALGRARVLILLRRIACHNGCAMRSSVENGWDSQEGRFQASGRRIDPSIYRGSSSYFYITYIHSLHLRYYTQRT